MGTLLIPRLGAPWGCGQPGASHGHLPAGPCRSQHAEGRAMAPPGWALLKPHSLGTPRLRSWLGGSSCREPGEPAGWVGRPDKPGQAQSAGQGSGCRPPPLGSFGCC